MILSYYLAFNQVRSIISTIVCVLVSCVVVVGDAPMMLVCSEDTVRAASAVSSKTHSFASLMCQ